VVDETPCLDLNYIEDSTARVDMNVVMTGAGKLVEVQGTAEHGVFDRSQLDSLLDLATKGVGELIAAQEAALGAGDED
jgi:ribonuclease PH